MAQSNKDVRHRHAALIRMNVTWLRQAFDLLERLSDEQFTASPARIAPHRIGGHLRHVLEFYGCFLHGLAAGRIDYDARARDQAVERERGAAMDRIRRIIQRLQNDASLLTPRSVRVRVEDVGPNIPYDPWLPSSIGRELQVLSSHTIHHFALIAITCKALDIELDAGFGVAPSTLRFRAARGEAA